jgi:hypothetical protein
MRISAAQHIMASQTKTTAVITNLSVPPSPQHPLLQYVAWFGTDSSITLAFLILLHSNFCHNKTAQHHER